MGGSDARTRDFAIVMSAPAELWTETCYDAIPRPPSIVSDFAPKPPEGGLPLPSLAPDSDHPAMLERQAVEAPGPRPRSSATPRRESPNGTGPAADPEVGRGRLLVVDDSPENVALLARLLGSLGYEVCTAATGRQALEMVKAEPPGAVLMDVMMPDLSGLDALKALRADPATTDLPVILVSGLGDTQDIVEGLRLGANDYVTKPINPAVLHARLEVHAALKHARDSLRATADRLEAELARRSKDLRVARSVQRALLPSRVPRVEGIEAAWHYQPADEVGGDLYDLIALPDGKIFLFLADAMGHGVQAALVAASVQGIITAHVAEAGPDVDLSALMERLDGNRRRIVHRPLRHRRRRRGRPDRRPGPLRARGTPADPRPGRDRHPRAPIRRPPARDRRRDGVPGR